MYYTRNLAFDLRYNRFVGLDVHKETIAVGLADIESNAPVSLGQIPNTEDALLRLLKRLGENKERTAFCYEAGPCGYEIYRFLKKHGYYCMVVAPSLIPTRVGDRVKTDRRDALKLARLFRSGDLTPVWVPDEEQEALRDLVRAREDIVQDVQRKRHQLSKFLLRLGKRPPLGINPWTVKHREWLIALRFEQVGQQAVLREYIHALDQAQASLKRLEKEMDELSRSSVHAPVIAALQALRGIQQLTAVTLVAELGDLRRFRSPAQLMAYAGLVPSENSSGQLRRRGSLTKTGNAHVRRVAVESAWHYRYPPKVSARLRRRQEGLTEQIKQISWNAQNRLNLKFRKLLGRGKPRQKAVVAVARELLGFIWSISCAVKPVLVEKAV